MGLDVGEIGMPLDLGLDLKQFVSRTAGRLAAKDPPASVDACIRGLEEERRKIEVFRRELPFCARLLAEVIEVMKEEAEKQTAARDAAAAAKADDDDKRKWMSNAQLWVDADPVPKEQEIESALPKPMLLGGGTPVPPMDFGFGVMSPPPPPPPASQFFIRDNSKVASAEGLPVLPMMMSSRPFSPPGDDRRHIAHPAKFATAMPPPGLSLQQTQEHQSRKTRRCWSTELHRQFVAALRQLGGPHVATPKQIREVMKVDGLTNDEVKSHLQKYRLHNQRTSPGSSSSSHPIMLVGDHLWAHQEHSSHSRSPEGPLQFSGSGVAVSALTTGSDSSEEDDRSEMISRALHL